MPFKPFLLGFSFSNFFCSVFYSRSTLLSCPTQGLYLYCKTSPTSLTCDCSVVFGPQSSLFSNRCRSLSWHLTVVFQNAELQTGFSLLQCWLSSILEPPSWIKLYEDYCLSGDQDYIVFLISLIWFTLCMGYPLSPQLYFARIPCWVFLFAT